MYLKCRDPTRNQTVLNQLLSIIVGDTSCQFFKDVVPFLFSRFLSVTLVFLCKSQRFLRVGLAVPILSTVASLRKMVAEEGGVPADEV